MRRGMGSLAALLFCILAVGPAAIAAGTTFTDIAQNPSSGLYLGDFSNGTAIFDFNNDGFDDIVVTNAGGTPDRLFMSSGNGTFANVAASAGVATMIKTLGIASADIDGNGYQDFLVFTEYSYGGGSTGPGLLYLNNGDQTFTSANVPEFTSSYGYEGYSCAFADYNRDGKLDVFYGGRLFKNLGNLQFDEVNNECGLGNVGFVAHAAFADVDNDLDPDLLICRQAGSVSLYLNNGTGQFSNATSNIAGSPYGLGGSFADIDVDGDLDLFISYSNKMYINDGTGHFALNANAGTYARYTRGAVLADFDNDGDPDLVLANEDGSSTYHENLGNGVFVDATAAVGMDNQQQKAGGVAVGDVDHDGDLDLYITKTDWLINPCFRNNLNNNHAIEVTPRGTVSNFAGIGAKVSLYQNGHVGNSSYLVSTYELTATSGFHAGTNGRVHLGTGAAGLYDVRVTFPSGISVDTSHVSSGSRLIVYESGEAPTYVYVSPAAASLTSDVDGPPQTVHAQITDSKNEGLAWTAVTSDSWLTVETPSGTTPSTLTVGVNPAGLPLGVHTGHVIVTATGSFNSPLSFTISLAVFDYLLTNVSGSVGLDDYDFTSGAAFFDYDLDGYDDIFVNNNYGQCRLYHSDGNSFTDVADAAGVAPAYHNLGLFGGDINADNLPDIITFTEDRQVGFTYMNTGFGTFADAGVDLFSTAWGYDGYAVNCADIDNDGDLDVFYGARLFRNDGDMNYTDITAEAGLSNIRFVCRVLFGDIDNDNDMDLFVNRQNLAVSLLFRNDGTGHFQNISSNSSLGYFPTGLGASFGDVDADGDLDLYTGAGYSDPNFMFINDGSGYFTDRTAASGTSCTNYTRGTEFFDVDNDGDLDLVVANENRSAQLFLNDGTGTFNEVTDLCGINDGLAKAGPAVTGDYDKDGDLDVYVGRTDNIRNSFFKNLTDNDHFITVTPVGIASNRAGVGAKMLLYPAGQRGNPDALFAYREYNISNGFSGSGPNYVHFGTGEVDLFDLMVIFPSGAVVTQTNVAPGSHLTVTESGEVPDYLVLTPGSFAFTFLEGDSARQAQMQIRNSAGNPIPWTAVVADNWCRLSSSSGTTNQTVTLTVDPSGLAPGYHETTITVAADDAVNSPRTATVRVTIAANQPVLALSTDHLDFTAQQGGNNPWSRSFTVQNVGQGTLNWTLQTSGETWLAAGPNSGTAPTDVAVSCSISGLTPGQYQAAIIVTAPGALNSPAALTVNLQIIPGQVPEKDSVRVASGSAQPGDHIVVPVTLHNIQTITAFSIPLAFDPDVLTCDSISYAGTRIDYINITMDTINNITGNVLFGMVVLTEANLAPGDGEVARLYMTVNVNAPEQVTIIDTAFFPPAGDLALIDPAAQTIVPEFVHGNIFIALNMRGDANGTGDVNLADGVYLINYIFRGQRPPIPSDAGDANSDMAVNMGDVVFVINYVFHDGPPPVKAAPPGRQKPVYYVIEQEASESGKVIRVNIDSDVPLGGMQLEIPDPAGFVTIISTEAGEMGREMDVYYGRVGGTHRFGMCDLDGSGLIRTGQGEVLRMSYTGFDDFRPEAFKVFDQYGNELPVKYGVREKTEAMPLFYDLAQNYPNPFNPVTTVEYTLAHAGHVELTIFNVLGQRVKGLVDADQMAGRYAVAWDGTDNAGDRVATAIYFYRLKTAEFTQTRKMALIK